MTSTELQKRLNELKIEDYIWILYIGIIGFSLYSNILERKYFVNKDMKSKEEYRSINTMIFTILVFVYAYFLNGSYKDFKNINNKTKNKDLITLSFIASLLIFVSGIIFLYISLIDKDLDIELAFN